MDCPKYLKAKVSAADNLKYLEDMATKMGVWQVTNETQPYVGQWDAVTDSFWDGLCWVQAQGPCAATPMMQLCTPEEAPKAQDPWEALKSMF